MIDFEEKFFKRIITILDVLVDIIVVFQLVLIFEKCQSKLKDFFIEELKIL